MPMMFAADRLGAKDRGCVSGHRLTVEAQIRTWEAFGCGHVSEISDPTREGADLGAAVARFDDRLPPIIEGQAFAHHRPRADNIGLRTLLLTIIAAAGCCAQAPLPGQALPQALFALREMDMHLHAGFERQVDMHAWIDLAVADGRRVLVLLDHLELYRPSRKAREYKAGYPLGSEGHKALMADFDGVAKRPGLIVFKGWEIFEGELDTGVESEPMRLADVIGWHISPNSEGNAPDGRSLIKRVRQIKEIQKTFPVPMIVFHPFDMRLEKVQRAARLQGRELKTLTAADYRFFQPGEQQELIGLLAGSSVYIEIGNSTARYFQDPVCRQALIADIRPLAEGGVQFTASTDNHSLANARIPFRPEEYDHALGVTVFNTNTIVRELLALRARRAALRD